MLNPQWLLCLVYFSFSYPCKNLSPLSISGRAVHVPVCEIKFMNQSNKYRKYCEGQRYEKLKEYSKVWRVEIVKNVNILSDNLPIIDIRPALLVFCWITWKEENVSDALSWCNMRFSAYLQWPWYGLSSISPWTNNITMA